MWRLLEEKESGVGDMLELGIEAVCSTVIKSLGIQQRRGRSDSRKVSNMSSNNESCMAYDSNDDPTSHHRHDAVNDPPPPRVLVPRHIGRP